MQQQELGATLPPLSETEVDELELRLQSRLSGRVRNLRLLVAESGVVLQGRARTYHAKQLAQHALMCETDLPILANEIEVC